jgi:hypothetical protein
MQIIYNWRVHILPQEQTVRFGKVTNQHGETYHTAQLLFPNLSRRFLALTSVVCNTLIKDIPRSVVVLTLYYSINTHC